jgi:hypothetical protein
MTMIEDSRRGRDRKTSARNWEGIEPRTGKMGKAYLLLSERVLHVVVRDVVVDGLLGNLGLRKSREEGRL